MKLNLVFAPALIGMLLAVCGCGSPIVSIDEGERDLEPADYRGVFDRWSRDFAIIPVDGVENVLTGRATHLSYEFRWAYVVREAYDLRLSPAERQTLREREFSKLDEVHEFVVTVMSGVNGAEQLEPDEGPWQIRLADDRGRQVAPVSIEKIRKPTHAETEYFEFDPVHRQAFRLLFPLQADDEEAILTPSTRTYRLLFSSPLGRAEIAWNTASNTD